MQIDRGCAGWIIFIMACIISLVFLVTALIGQSHARDLGQWDNADPELKQWYESLKQPDVPNASCCSEADGYYADKIHVKDGKVYATITDDRPDEPRGRPHREIGETFEVPPNKMNKDPNPTGHNIIFLSKTGYVYCFVSGTGS
jgi:hypothetical protein